MTEIATTLVLQFAVFSLLFITVRIISEARRLMRKPRRIGPEDLGHVSVGTVTIGGGGNGGGHGRRDAIRTNMERSIATELEREHITGHGGGRGGARVSHDSTRQTDPVGSGVVCTVTRALDANGRAVLTGYEMPPRAAPEMVVLVPPGTIPLDLSRRATMAGAVARILADEIRGVRPFYVMKYDVARDEVHVDVHPLPPPGSSVVVRWRETLDYGRANYAMRLQNQVQGAGALTGNPALDAQLRRINEDPGYRAPSEEHRLTAADECGRLYHVHSDVGAMTARFAAAVANLPPPPGTLRHWRSYVEVVNPTPASKNDGLSVHRLSVPITCRTARAAVAWTYDLAEADYHPEVRT